MLVADTHGFFGADGQVNGKPVRFVVDTGASLITFPARDARRLELDYEKGQKVSMATANGIARGYRIKLNTVSVGNITLNGIEAVVLGGRRTARSAAWHELPQSHEYEARGRQHDADEALLAESLALGQRTRYVKGEKRRA
jgi:clan AA aspartic protease (TIGR02281 family)